MSFKTSKDILAGHTVTDFFIEAWDVFGMDGFGGLGRVES